MIFEEQWGFIKLRFGPVKWQTVTQNGDRWLQWEGIYFLHRLGIRCNALCKCGFLFKSALIQYLCQYACWKLLVAVIIFPVCTKVIKPPLPEMGQEVDGIKLVQNPNLEAFYLEIPCLCYNPSTVALPGKAEEGICPKTLWKTPAWFV